VAKPTVTEAIVGRALRALRLENDWLSTTVLLDHGADIHTLVYKPNGVHVPWKPPRPPREPGVGPTPTGDSFAVWVAHYRGGWQTIFPNFGPAGEYKGNPLDFHGKAARTVWQLEALAVDDEQASVSMRVTLLKSHFRIQRRMSLNAHQALLSIFSHTPVSGRRPAACVSIHFSAPRMSQPLSQTAATPAMGSRPSCAKQAPSWFWRQGRAAPWTSRPCCIPAASV
jgi:hypothetical protein